MPRVYRGTFRIHAFAVLVAVLVGAQLLGILGVLLALPVAAAVPAVVRIWREEAAAEPATSSAVPKVDAAHATEPPAPP